MTDTWVPAYRSLYQREKKGLAHSTRSIFLLLCLEAYESRQDGRVALPRGKKDDAAALHELAGGSRREAALALAELTVVPPDGEPMVRLEGEDGFRSLVILSWERWALRGSEAPSSPKPRSAAAARAARYRAKKVHGVTDRDGKRDGERDGERDASRSVTPHRDGRRGVERNAGGERGGVSAVRSGEEQADKKDPTHTASAREMATADDLAELLRETPVLALLADDPRAVQLVLGGFHMAHGDRATPALARQAVARLAGREGVRLQGAPVAMLAERLGTYLTDQRLRQAAGPQPPGALPQAVRETLHVFGQEWTRAKNKPFVAGDGDETRAAKLLGAAERACAENADRKLRPLEVVRRWAHEYVRDADPFCANREHPLALLPARVTSYGLPKGGPVRPAPAPQPTATPESFAAPPLDLSQIGGGGSGSVPPRPGGKG